MTCFYRHCIFGALMLLAAMNGLGCISTITAHQVTDDSNEDGLRYYLPAPYLIVEQATNGQWDASLQLGVDRSRSFTVDPKTYLATSTATVSFNTDGTLKSFSLSQDATTVSSAVVTALQTIGTKVIDAQAANTPKPGGTTTTPKAKEGAADAAPEPAPNSSCVQASVYRIAGTELIPVTPSPLQFGFPTVSAGGSPAAAASAALKVQVDPTGDYQIARSDGQAMTQEDVNRLTFFISEGAKRVPLPADQAAALRGKASLKDGAVTLLKKDAQDAQVQAVALGDSTSTNIPH